MMERKVVKLKVNMYEDTKFKIIDMKPERDLIHYVWIRLVTLAGKVNLAGDLFMSRNLKYTIETLAIEFNRDSKQIKLALDVFMELEMVELSEDNVYRVINFAKHQNIKVKEKIRSIEEVIKPIEELIKTKEIEVKEDEQHEKEPRNEISQNEVEVVKIDDKNNPEITSSIINKVDNTSKDKNNINVQNTNHIPSEPKKNKKINKKKGKEEIENLAEEAETEDVVSFHDYDENEHLREGVVCLWETKY